MVMLVKALDADGGPGTRAMRRRRMSIPLGFSARTMAAWRHCYGRLPASTAAGVTLASGTLWVEASLFGTPFASVPGFAGIPFSACL
jgi:transposase